MPLHISFHPSTEPDPFPTPRTQGTQAHKERFSHRPSEQHSSCCLEHLKEEKKSTDCPFSLCSLTKFLKTESINVQNFSSLPL